MVIKTFTPRIAYGYLKDGAYLDSQNHPFGGHCPPILYRFYMSEDVRLPMVINACLGVAIALGMSGVRNASISKAAEWP